MSSGESIPVVGRWKIDITFEPSPINKAEYELKSMKLTTRKMSILKVKELAEEEAKKCWPHYKIKIGVV